MMKEKKRWTKIIDEKVRKVFESAYNCPIGPYASSKAASGRSSANKPQ